MSVLMGSLMSCTCTGSRSQNRLFFSCLNFYYWKMCWQATHYFYVLHTAKIGSACTRSCWVLPYSADWFGGSVKPENNSCLLTKWTTEFNFPSLYEFVFLATTGLVQTLLTISVRRPPGLPQIMGEHCESLDVWPLDFWKVLIKVLNLCYEILRFLKSVASVAQYADINFNARFLALISCLILGKNLFFP